MFLKMLTRHLVYVLIVLFFVDSNGTKFRIMETQLVPEFYECDGLKCENFTEFNKLPFDELRKLAFQFVTNPSDDKNFCFFYGNKTSIRHPRRCKVDKSLLNATYEIAFGRDLITTRFVLYFEGDNQPLKRTLEYLNGSPMSMISHFGFIAKNVSVKKITAQGWIYNGQSFDPFTKLLARSDESCEFYIGFDQAQLKPFIIYLISEKVIHHIKVVAKENPTAVATSVGLLCGLDILTEEKLKELGSSNVDDYRNLHIHIVEDEIKLYAKLDKNSNTTIYKGKEKCTLQSKGPYHIVVPKDLPINVVKIAPNFLARNILK